jgi:hypothetical protein
MDCCPPQLQYVWSHEGCCVVWVHTGPPCPTLGPKVTPPPGNSGDLLLPRRALPVPFCLYGFLPPPRTSERVSVLAVPCNDQQCMPG